MIKTFAEMNAEQRLCWLVGYRAAIREMEMQGAEAPPDPGPLALESEFWPWKFRPWKKSPEQTA